MKLRICLLALVFCACFGSQAFAGQSYSAIYVFGDSYCDTGNIDIVTLNQIPKSPPYYYGHFSNGPIWVEYLASQFHLPVLPALLGGTNYALGGAEMLKENQYPQGLVPSVPEEVEAYLFLHGGKADPNALYVVEGGGLDILDATAGSPLQLGYEVGSGLLGLETVLYHAGARHFFIPNLPNIGLTPDGAVNATFENAAAISANQVLSGGIPALMITQGVDIYTVDNYTATNTLFADPAAAGFTNVTTPCLNTTTFQVCADPQHTLFWDGVHPTTGGHLLIALLAASVVHP